MAGPKEQNQSNTIEQIQKVINQENCPKIKDRLKPQLKNILCV